MPGCSAKNCKNCTEYGFRLFKFPADANRRESWLQNMKRDNWTPNSGTRLCEVHFENSQWEMNRRDGWRKLKPNAVPTLFDIPNTQPRTNSAHKENEKIKQLKRELQKYKLLCRNLEKQIEEMKKQNSDVIQKLSTKNEELQQKLKLMEDIQLTFLNDPLIQ